MFSYKDANCTRVISNLATSMSRVELLTNKRQAQCIYKVNFVNTGSQRNLFSLKLEVLQSIVLHLFKNTGKLDCKTSPLLLSKKIITCCGAASNRRKEMDRG